MKCDHNPSAEFNEFTLPLKYVKRETFRGWRAIPPIHFSSAFTSFCLCLQLAPSCTHSTFYESAGSSALYLVLCILHTVQDCLGYVLHGN